MQTISIFFPLVCKVDARWRSYNVTLVSLVQGIDRDTNLVLKLERGIVGWESDHQTACL